MTDLGWITIPNWDDFQHYKNREPSWIKVYTRLLDDDDYLNLTETQRCALHSIWMAFAKANGKLAADTRKLSNRFAMRVTKPTLIALVDAGFICVSASRPLAGRYQSASTTLASRAPAPSQEEEAETEEQQQQIVSSIGVGSRDVTDRTDSDSDSEWKNDLAPLAGEIAAQLERIQP
jgi:hypothetical protein